MQMRVTGRGTPIVLVGGGLTGWLGWDKHTEHLESTRQVIRVQQISVQFGLEHRPLPKDYSVQTESQAFAGVLDSLKLAAPVDIVAWSFGGAVMLDYVLDHPDRVRSLTLIEPPALWVLGDAKPAGAEYQSMLELSKIITDPVTEAQLAQFARAAGLCPPGKAPQDLPQWPLWMQHRQSLLNTPAVFTNHNDLARLRTFQPPVLLVKGTGSAAFLHQIIDSLAVQLPHARVIELPAGHAPQIVSMDRFLLDLAAFQKSLK